MKSKVSDELTPQEIRHIREKLGLTQVEAGELLGGGPRAFTKYESGTIKPTTATANLLRLLDAKPSAISTLSGGTVSPMESEDTRLLEVTGRHIAALGPRKLVLLTRRLLDGEAFSGDLPMDGIHVAANITLPTAGRTHALNGRGGRSGPSFCPTAYRSFS